MAETCVVIVDPYSSGAMLADALRQAGSKCIAVESSTRLPAAMKSRFRPRSFADVIQHDSQLEKTLTAVRAHHPTHVVAGFESGVEVAEQLGQRLGLPANDPRQGRSRRDKFLMIEAVRARGLAAPKQFQSNRVDEMLEWIRGSLTWPVILKPPKSVATDSVFSCRRADDVRRSAAAILSGSNVLGEKNEKVLVQEFLHGEEYVVDLVCLDGQKSTTAIWQYSRSSGCLKDVGYDAMTLLPYHGKLQQALESYAFEVVDALAIGFGPAHCEIMWVSDHPVLIEVGARLTTGNNAVLSRICGGICQLDKTVEAILNPECFHANLNSTPTLNRRAVNVFLMPQRPGRLIRTHGLETIRRLPTVYCLSVGAKPGDNLSRVAGLVTLVGDDVQAIERDIAVIRDLEHAGIFEVVQPLAGPQR